MKILEIARQQNTQAVSRAANNAGAEQAASKPQLVRENLAAEVTISEEGQAAWKEAEEKKRLGSFGVMAGMEEASKLPKIESNEVYWEHLMELGEAMEEVKWKYNQSGGEGADAFMKTVMDAYEIVYRKILEEHKDGNRDVSYELSGDRSLTLEEDLAGLDEAYDLWVGYVDAYINMAQRMKDWRPTGVSGGSAEGAEGVYEKKYTGDEYNEYRHNAVSMMRQGRKDFLELFRTMNETEGIAVGVLSNLMNKNAGFWAKTHELWTK